MYKDERYINAGTNEIYRWGHKAIDKVKSNMEPNENGFYSIPADGGKYWTLGTSEGKYGEFINYKGTFFSVNRAGNAWAKAGSEKADKFVAMLNDMISFMEEKNAERFKEDPDEEDE